MFVGFASVVRTINFGATPNQFCILTYQRFPWVLFAYNESSTSRAWS